MFEDCQIKGKTPVKYMDDPSRPFGILKPSDISFCDDEYGKKVISSLSSLNNSFESNHNHREEEEEENDNYIDDIINNNVIVEQNPNPIQQINDELKDDKPKKKRGRKRKKQSDISFSRVEEEDDDDENEDYNIENEYLDDDDDDDDGEESEDEFHFENDNNYRNSSEQPKKRRHSSKRKAIKQKTTGEGKEEEEEEIVDPPHLKCLLYDVIWDKIIMYPCIIVSLKDQNDEGISKYKSSKIEIRNRIPVIYFCSDSNQYATIDSSNTDIFTFESIFKYNQYERDDIVEQQRFEMAISTAFYCSVKANGRERLKYLESRTAGCCRCYNNVLNENVRYIYCDKCYLCYDYRCAGFKTVPQSIENETFYCYRCKRYLKYHPELENREEIIIASKNNNDDHYLYNIFWDKRYYTPCIVIDIPDMNDQALKEYNRFKGDEYMPIRYFCELKDPYGFAKEYELEAFNYESIFKNKKYVKTEEEMKHFVSSVATAFFCQNSKVREYRLDCMDDKYKGCCKCFKKMMHEKLSSLLVCSNCCLYYHWKCEKFTEYPTDISDGTYICNMCRERSIHSSHFDPIFNIDNVKKEKL